MKCKRKKMAKGGMLKGGQKKIAKQAEPKDKITKADFKKLKAKKKMAYGGKMK
jgi:hypothetical protein